MTRLRARAARSAVAVLVVAAAAVPGTPVADQAQTPAPARVMVGTSRGEFQLQVYAARRSGPSSSTPRPRPLVLLFSGEGGWRDFDDQVAAILAGDGCWVGGIDAMEYFWKPQDDRGALVSDTRAFAGALAKAAGRPQTTPLILAGFSFGADLAPWIAGAGGWDGRVRGLLMIGPDETGSLQFRLSEILGFHPRGHLFSVAEALGGVAGIPVLFVHGEKDPNSAAVGLHTRAPAPKRLIVVRGADHHFSKHEEDLRGALLEGIEWMLQGPPGAP